MAKSRSREKAFDEILGHIVAMLDSMEDETILYSAQEDFDDDVLEEELSEVKNAIGSLQYTGHGTYVDPGETVCTLCQKKKSPRTMSTYQVQGMRLTVCRACVRNLIEQEIMSV